MKIKKRNLSYKEIQEEKTKLIIKADLRKRRFYRIWIYLFFGWILFCFLSNFPKILGLWLKIPSLSRFPLNCGAYILFFGLWCVLSFEIFKILDAFLNWRDDIKWQELEDEYSDEKEGPE